IPRRDQPRRADALSASDSATGSAGPYLSRPPANSRGNRARKRGRQDPWPASEYAATQNGKVGNQTLSPPHIVARHQRLISSTPKCRGSHMDGSASSQSPSVFSPANSYIANK